MNYTEFVDIINYHGTSKRNQVMSLGFDVSLLEPITLIISLKNLCALNEDSSASASS
jgi:hypothetical protein